MQRVLIERVSLKSVCKVCHVHKSGIILVYKGSPYTALLTGFCLRRGQYPPITLQIDLIIVYSHSKVIPLTNTEPIRQSNCQSIIASIPNRENLYYCLSLITSEKRKETRYLFNFRDFHQKSRVINPSLVFMKINAQFRGFCSMVGY